MSSDIEELKALVASMAKKNAKMQAEAAARDRKAEERAAEMKAENAKMQAEMQAESAKMQRENAKLITALSGAGNLQPPGQPGGIVPVNPAAVRQEKLAKLSLALRKSTKVKDFREAQECNVKDWLKRLDQELQILKKMSGIVDNLSRAEIIDCIKDKLDYAVIKRLDTAFAAKEAPLKWDEVTTEELISVLTAHRRVW